MVGHSRTRVNALEPDLYHQLKDRLPPGDSDLRRTVDAWFTGVVQRTVPKAIIPGGVDLEEVPMLEENLIAWRDKAAREAHREGQIVSLRGMLLEQMTQRFGRLPVSVRRQIEGISSIQELRKLGRKVLRARSLGDMGLGS